MNEKVKGCGKEVCAVQVRGIDNKGEDTDIQTCGEYCPYHKQIHYCDKCKSKEVKSK